MKIYISPNHFLPQTPTLPSTPPLPDEKPPEYLELCGEITEAFLTSSHLVIERSRSENDLRTSPVRTPPSIDAFTNNDISNNNNGDNNNSNSNNGHNHLSNDVNLCDNDNLIQRHIMDRNGNNDENIIGDTNNGETVSETTSGTMRDANADNQLIP